MNFGGKYYFWFKWVFLFSFSWELRVEVTVWYFHWIWLHAFIIWMEIFRGKYSAIKHRRGTKWVIYHIALHHCNIIQQHYLKLELSLVRVLCPLSTWTWITATAYCLAFKLWWVSLFHPTLQLPVFIQPENML